MTPPRLLVANRGEIAVRVIRGCRDLGISPVAVYSEPDRAALHVRMADFAVGIGPAPARDSYLVIDRLVDAAKKTGATFVHPGYGFLAENAAFAQAVTDAGLTWVGPPASAIAAMGSKTAARARVEKAGVPIVPGLTTPAQDADAVAAFARVHGFPLLLKAAAGGGGKGMRVVRNESEIASALERARGEARSYFGDDSVYVELYVEKPRHVEIQVLGDTAGRIVALGERECSLQRRHQKVMEECPSPAVSLELRARMEEVAVAAARSVDYVSAGTVEFLLAGDGRFFFLEMNTRIQVEHPVTELVYGVDLVAEMIRIARGEAMSVAEKPQAAGHAIECRLYAEDPAHDFAPSPGRIRRLRLPFGPGVRVDAGVEEGDSVPLDYDPMLGKLVVWGRDRDEALRRTRRALDETRIEGIETSVPFFQALLRDPRVLANDVSTQFLETFAYEPPPVAPELREASVLAASLERDAEGRRARPVEGPVSTWRSAPPTWGRT